MPTREARYDLIDTIRGIAIISMIDRKSVV